MSQKKVDLYKEQKANRDKIIKKEKRMALIERIAVSAVALVAAGWICFSVYNKATQKDDSEIAKETTDLNVSAIDDFMSSVHELEHSGEAE